MSVTMCRCAYVRNNFQLLLNKNQIKCNVIGFCGNEKTESGERERVRKREECMVELK